jgi:hypothetical protein
VSGHPFFLYDVGVKFWISSGVGWGVAVLALVGIAKLPGKSLDLYFSDRYVPVSKTSLAITVILVFVLPLVAVTFRHIRSTQH